MEKIKSDEMVLKYQQMYYKGKAPNSFSPVADREKRVLEKGITLENEVCYGTEYPNSFADIYHCGKTDAPTLIYLHGGGWFMGNRTDGDPLAAGGGGIARQNIFLAEKGFHVISMDYCLAPEYRFPTQLTQINAGLRYFTEHAAEYALNMKKIVIFGGSAGAVLAAQLGGVYGNPFYAKTVGVWPSIEREAIRGIAIDGAPMNPKLFDDGVSAMVMTWLGTNDLSAKDQEEKIHMSRWATENWPRVFLTAGNEGCFLPHTKELGNALRKVGVEVDEYYPDPAVSKEGHGYMGNFETSAQAREGIERQAAFFDRVTK